MAAQIGPRSCHLVMRAPEHALTLQLTCHPLKLAAIYISAQCQCDAPSSRCPDY
jgi:hypothetical protein